MNGKGAAGATETGRRTIRTRVYPSLRLITQTVRLGTAYAGMRANH